MREKLRRIAKLSTQHPGILKLLKQLVTLPTLRLLVQWITVQTTNNWGFYNLLPSHISPPPCSAHSFPRTSLILTEESVLTSDWNNKISSSYKNCWLFALISNSVCTAGKRITPYLFWYWPFIFWIIYFFITDFLFLPLFLRIAFAQQRRILLWTFSCYIMDNTLDN